MGERGGSGVSAREGCRGAAKGLVEGSLAVLACSQAPHGSWSWICAVGLGGAPCRCGSSVTSLVPSVHPSLKGGSSWERQCVEGRRFERQTWRS